MSRMRGSAASALAPEVLLRKATLAQTPGQKARYAQRGLEVSGPIDDTTRALLLRQLYLSRMESRRFEEARQVAEEMVHLEVMTDVARQDAARAYLGLGELDRAIDHMRLAGRTSPPNRKAFHLWTLGTTLYLHEREREAVSVLRRAVRWSTTERPLYEAQLALARIACGDEPEAELEQLRDRLAHAPAGQGYGQFVLGELAALTGDRDAAIAHLEGFVERTSQGRVALAVALKGEISRAKSLLRDLKRRVPKTVPPGA